MASYPPPNYIEPLPIFNTTNWIPNTSTAGAGGALDPRYLRFPVAQGTESFNDLISVGTANLTNISIDDPTSVSSSSISQSTAGILTIDNNEATSGSIVFKANNSISAEQTILTLSGDSGTTATLPIIANGGLTTTNASITDTLSIFNGVNSATLDMNASNNLQITNTNNVEVAGALIKLDTTTLGGLTSSTTQPAPNDSSNKIPTTAWVQSAISGGLLASPMPYYQAYYFLNAPANFDRYATFQFNFTGTNWGINDYFSISLRCSLITTTNNASVAPNYATFNTIIDVYPARCPANNTNPSAYGVNPTQPNTTNFSLLNGSIYNGGLQSAYVITSAGAPYAPYGRWYFSNNYTIWTSGTAYPTTSPNPIAPYIQYGTAEKSAFGFGLWGSSFVYSEFAINTQVINRGPNGVGQGITLSSNYTLGGGSGNTLNEVKVGL